MCNSVICITAHFNVKTEKISEAQKLLYAMLEPTRNETGCLKYDLYQDLENPERFSFIEEWETAESLESHRKTEHYQLFRSQIPDVLANPVQVYRMKQIF